MIEKFRKTRKLRGQTLKWFYDNHIKDNIVLTYGGLCHQLNGYSPLSDEVKTEIEKYTKLNDI